MKKIIIALGILSFLLTANTSIAEEIGDLPIIDKIEHSMFGYTYLNEDESLRLNRIEESVYGNVTIGTNEQRIAKLKKDLAADLIGKEIKPKEDTFAEEPELIAERPIPQGADIDYPAINELEKQVFKKEFKEKNLDERLASLEQRSLGKTFPGEDFKIRADRLIGALQPNFAKDDILAQFSDNNSDEESTPLGLDNTDSPDQINYNAYNAAYNNGFGMPKKVNVEAIENSLLKKTYPDDDMENRLARLENSMFGLTFDKNSQQDRMSRIGSAYTASKTADKYDVNRSQQHMATGMQIGMFFLMLIACVI